MLAALALGSCVRDLGGNDNKGVVVGDDEALVTLSLSMPAAPPSRAIITTPDENDIDEVDVLLFKSDGTFYYRAIGTTPTPDPANPGVDSKKVFTAKLPLVTSYRMVVLANARAAINASGYASVLTPATIATGTPPSREQVLNSINIPVNTGKLTVPGIPMWGYKDGVTIDAGTSSPISIDLTRAIVRIDVSSIAALFTIDSVLLYNYNTAGTVVPLAIGTGTGYDESAPHLTASTPPTVALGYAVSEGSIYTFEADAGTDGTITNTCLVIGGKYNGSLSTTYYRVEFVDEDGDFLPLLRNHCYQVTIQDVKDHGYPTPYPAYVNKPSNIRVTITEWNDGGLNDITFNDQHYLAVDKSVLEFYAVGAPKTLRVKTDFPGAWTITGLPTGWLTIADIDPAAAVNTESTVTLQVTGAPGVNDNDYFFVVAGNLKKRINLVYHAEEEFSLAVDPASLTFYKTPGGPKTVTLYPYPVTYALDFITTPNFTWTTSTLVATTLTLRPVPNATGAVVNGTVLVTLTGPSGQELTRTINVKQLAHDIPFAATPANPYPAAAGSYALLVDESGAAWELYDVTDATSDPDDIITITDATEHPATASPVPYTFSLAALTTYHATRSARILVRSSDPEFPTAGTYYIDITQAGAPFITVTVPSTKAHDFGATATPVPVTIETNAAWQYETDADYASVVSGATYGGSALAAGTITTNTTSPATKVEEIVTFTPSTVGFPAPLGTLLSTTVTFRTALASGNVYDEMLLTLENPEYWAFVSSTPAANGTVAAAGGDVTVVANTNTDWWLKVGASGTPSGTTITAGTYATSNSHVVAVPPRPDEAASWAQTNNDLESTIYCGYGSTVKHDFLVKQPPYAITVSGLPTAAIAKTGASVTFTATSTAPAGHGYTLVLKAGSTEVGRLATNGTEEEKTITVADYTGLPRTITVWCEEMTGGSSLGSFVQGTYTQYLLVYSDTGATNLACPANTHRIVPYDEFHLSENYWFYGDWSTPATSLAYGFAGWYKDPAYSAYFVGNDITDSYTAWEIHPNGPLERLWWSHYIWVDDLYPPNYGQTQITKTGIVCGR